MKRKIKRRCLICGKNIYITFNSRKYANGHYFGDIKLPFGSGEYKKLRTTKIGRHNLDVVKWTGKEKRIEYWECNKCFEEALHECWLEEKIEKLFGKRCKEYEPHCPVCEAWSLYDIVINDRKEKLQEK